MHLSHFLYFFIHNAYRDVDKRSHNLFEDAIKVFVFTITMSKNNNLSNEYAFKLFIEASEICIIYHMATTELIIYSPSFVG